VLATLIHEAARCRVRSGSQRHQPGRQISQ
jgi:hypothetical protein